MRLAFKICKTFEILVLANHRGERNEIWSVSNINIDSYTIMHSQLKERVREKEKIEKYDFSVNRKIILHFINNEFICHSDKGL